MSGDPVGTGQGDEARHARLVLETANDAYVSIDQTGRIVDWNPAAERILGWPRREALGRPLAETVVPERFRADHHRGIERLQRTGEGPILFTTLELPALHRDGHEVPVELTIWPSELAGDVRYNAFLRDVSERTRMQAHLRLLQRVTAAANAADRLEDAVVSALEEVAALTGWPVGHAYVRGWDHDHLDPAGWWTAGAEPFERFRVVTEQSPFEEGVGLPGRVAASGQPDWIADLAADANFPRQRAAVETGLASAFAFPVLAGTRVVAVLEFYAARRDVPGEQLLELMANIGIQLGRVFERLHWRTELQEAVDTKSRLLAMVAHEVRTPLVVIEGFAKLLGDDWEALDDDTKLEYLDAIGQHTARLQRITTSALRISRIERGGEQARPQPVDLDEMLDRVVHGLDLPDVTVDAPAGLTVEVDPDHLEQILVNYLTNARTYGAPPIRVEAAADAPVADGGRPTATVRVCDRGEGVPPAFEPELFTSFRRGTSDGGGAGLGLSIVHRLAELNDGEVWYEPLDPGAAFALRLPGHPRQ